MALGAEDVGVTIRPFGTLPDGRAVQLIALGKASGLLIEILDYGAILHRLNVPARNGRIDVLPRYDDLSGYLADQAFLNAAVGRFANRLDGGRFSIDGQQFQASLNEGQNSLHGGVTGFGRRLWSIEGVSDTAVDLLHVSADGEDGFPGQVHARVRFALVDDTRLSITFEATTNRATPINLTQHLYFNLSGETENTILDHTLQIAGTAITAVRADLIPTGELMPVAESPFDLTSETRIRDILAQAHSQLALAEGIDVNWVLDRAPVQARLFAPASGLALEISTNQPGLQVYSGQKLRPPFVRWGAIALEPQNFPDAPNHEAFPESILRPGQSYRNETIYRFIAT